MRPSRTLAATVVAAALATATPGHADDDRRSGAFVHIRPTVKRNAVDFLSWASSTGGPLGAYVAEFTVHGMVTADGYGVAVDDQWTQAMTRPGTTKPEHHVYPADKSSEAVLVYTGHVMAAGTGIPSGWCQSVLTKAEGQPPVVVGSC